MQNYEAWFRKHRPKNIEDIILPTGLPEQAITKFYNQSLVQGNILSHGPAGYGKTSVNDLLISRIIKSPQDLLVLGRGVDDIDKLRIWLKMPVNQSTQKIVKIEEMDKLSPKALTLLKDGLMEDYQKNCTFLATTNHPEKLNSAILSRFNLKINFKEIDPKAAAIRISRILELEKIVFEPKAVQDFCKRYIGFGLRDILNNIELASLTGTFDPSSLSSFTGADESETNIIMYLVYLVKYTETKTLQEVNNILVNVKSDNSFFEYYDYTAKLLKDNIRVNYDIIFRGLLDNETLDLTSKKIITDYYQVLDTKPFKSMHLFSALTELLINVSVQKGQPNIIIKG